MTPVAPIVVIGGGPAGSVCARQLSHLGHDVVLVERRNGSRSRLGETCGPGTRRLLEGVCGLSLPRATHRLFPAFHSAWGSGALDGRRVEFWHAEKGLVLDRRAFDDWLLGSAEAAGVTVLRGCHVAGGRSTGAEWILSGLAGGQERELVASFVVEATGARARTVLLPDVTRFFTDALVCVSVELPEHASEEPGVLVESCRAGWWYAVRLPNGQRMAALFTDADLVEPAKNRLSWLKTLLRETAHVRRLADPLPHDLRIDVCNARTSVRNVFWRKNWVSIGDATWSLDPLSGTGIERAIRDGIEVASSISRAMISGDIEPLRIHALSRANDFRSSLVAQRRYYSVETRWSDGIFWRRRRCGPALARARRHDTPGTGTRHAGFRGL